MSQHPEREPVQGDQVMRHLGLNLSSLVAGSDRLSEALITPFIDAAAMDFDSLPPATKQIIMGLRAEADRGWRQYRKAVEEEVKASGLTPEEYEERGMGNLLGALKNNIEPTE